MAREAVSVLRRADRHVGADRFDATSGPRLAAPTRCRLQTRPRQPLLVQTDYLNSGLTQKEGRKWKTKTELYSVDPMTVTAHAGMLFLNERGFELPQGHSVQTSRCTVTGEGVEARELRIIGLGGHYHFRGRAIEAYRVRDDSSLGERLYGYEGFDQPDFRQYTDNPIVLHPGEGIEWRCAYENDGSGIPGAPAPVYGVKEHCCLLFGAYYPTETLRRRSSTGTTATRRETMYSRTRGP
jgi:hypothetical protein